MLNSETLNLDCVVYLKLRETLGCFRPFWLQQKKPWPENGLIQHHQKNWGIAQNYSKNIKSEKVDLLADNPRDPLSLNLEKIDWF